MREIDFSRKTIRKQWKLVNNWYKALENEDGDAESLLLMMAKTTMEMGMDLKRYQRLVHSRSQGHWNKANGFYCRHLDTTFGAIENLRVPRLRRDQQPYRWFEHYKRRWKKVDKLLLNCFVGGLSTRRAVKIMNRNFGWGLSPATITRLSAKLHEVLQGYRTCKISDEYTGLILDGAWYRFRQLYGPKRVVLAVLGVKADGVVVLLGFHVARSESALEVGRILRDLKSRGLAGKNLKILVADGAGGIEAAAAEIYPWAPVQRCCWHQFQMLKQYVTDVKIARQMMQEAAKCYHSHDARAVQKHLQQFIAKWKDKQPVAIRAFSSRLDQTLTYLNLPQHMHRWFRTTNLLERLFRDIRSRTKLIGSFDQPIHLEKILIATILEVQWVQMPIDLQPFLVKDTII